MTAWPIYRADGSQHDSIDELPHAPPWRDFKGMIPEDYKAAYDLMQEAINAGTYHLSPRRTTKFEAQPEELELINTALYLRRPLLVTGKPGIGKSTLAYAVAHELKLGPVLVWPITSRSTLKDGLYTYDPIGRLQETHRLAGKLANELQNSENKDVPIGDYIRLGPLGTALLPGKRPRVLLIDEIDKSDIDLPNDLLNVFEEGEFEIPELVRLRTRKQFSEPVHVHVDDGLSRATLPHGRVMCHEFPFIIITSNGERELPAPFLRRCIRLEINPPTDLDVLADIIEAHFGFQTLEEKIAQKDLIKTFLDKRAKVDLATDQLLNAIYLSGLNIDLEARTPNKQKLIDDILRALSSN